MNQISIRPVDNVRTTAIAAIAIMKIWAKSYDGGPRLGCNDHGKRYDLSSGGDDSVKGRAIARTAGYPGRVRLHLKVLAVEYPPELLRNNIYTCCRFPAGGEWNSTEIS